MFSPIVASATLLALFLLLNCTSGAARERNDENRLGLSCRKILDMTPEEWAEYHNKKAPGGEVGYDQAYVAYAECMRERTETLLVKLPHRAAERLRKYRKLCSQFRVDDLLLQQAFAGGGTMYTHAASRGEVDDERLIEKLLGVYSRPAPERIARSLGVTLSTVRRRLQSQRPDVASNAKALSELSTSDQAASAYKAVTADLNAISTLLTTERMDAYKVVVKFLDNSSRGD